nr:hypothetical protein [Pseudomonadota bacterium]
MDDNNPFPQRAILHKLTGQLAQIQDLWDRLIHVKWSRDAFALLAPLARDMAQAARSHEYASLADLAARLEQQISACLAAGRLPQGVE